MLLADDQHLVRTGFRVLLEASGQIEVVGEAADGAEAITLASRLRPQVVLMDLQMPGTDGLAATRAITSDADLTEIRIIMLTTYQEDEQIFAALRIGASGYLVKDATTEELLHAIEVVAKGEALLAPSVTRRLIEVFAAGPQAAPPSTGELAILTDREREVLALVGSGLSNDEIAARLVISPLTARTHVSRILTKTGARDRAQLVVLAYESRIIQPGGSAR